jgi:hypothetical protein
MPFFLYILLQNPKNVYCYIIIKIVVCHSTYYIPKLSLSSFVNYIVYRFKENPLPLDCELKIVGNHCRCKTWYLGNHYSVRLWIFCMSYSSFWTPVCHMDCVKFSLHHNVNFSMNKSRDSWSSFWTLVTPKSDTTLVTIGRRNWNVSLLLVALWRAY